MNRTLIPALIMGIVTTFLMSPAGLSAQGTDEDDPVRFGSLPAISAVPIIYAEENGYFDAEGAALDILPSTRPPNGTLRSKPIRSRPSSAK